MIDLWRAFLLALAAVSALACTSPEWTWTLGGGPGADVGNPHGPVQIHAGAYMYYDIRTQGPRIGQSRFIGSAAEAEER